MLRSTLAYVVLATALLSLSACAAAPLNKPIEGGPVDTGAATLASARSYLEGRWSLESFELHPPGKPVVTVNGSGMLTYDAYSNLDIEIRADQATSSVLRAAGIDIRDGVISSKGRTAVDMQNRTLTYVITGQPVAEVGPLAMNRPRYWSVEGNLLTVTTRDDAGNPASVARWRKMQ